MWESWFPNSITCLKCSWILIIISLDSINSINQSIMFSYLLILMIILIILSYSWDKHWKATMSQIICITGLILSGVISRRDSKQSSLRISSIISLTSRNNSIIFPRWTLNRKSVIILRFKISDKLLPSYSKNLIRKENLGIVLSKY